MVLRLYAPPHPQSLQICFHLPSMKVCLWSEPERLYFMAVQQIDSILSSLATPNSSLEMPFRVISGANTITVLAHVDHKHRKNLSTAKKINWFSSHYFLH